MSSRHLFAQLTNLVCQKLIFGSKWKTDFLITLSAFELVSGMAQMNIINISKCNIVGDQTWVLRVYTVCIYFSSMFYIFPRQRGM